MLTRILLAASVALFAAGSLATAEADLAEYLKSAEAAYAPAKEQP